MRQWPPDVAAFLANAAFAVVGASADRAKYGNKVLRTPHIDAIAGRGRRFDRFYVATPVCMPNRATIMTGRMPSLHGVRHNGIALSLHHTTFVEVLRATGYATALIGKSHLQNFTPEPVKFAKKRNPERSDSRSARRGHTPAPRACGRAPPPPSAGRTAR